MESVTTEPSQIKEQGVEYIIPNQVHISEVEQTSLKNISRTHTLGSNTNEVVFEGTVLYEGSPSQLLLTTKALSIKTTKREISLPLDDIFGASVGEKNPLSFIVHTMKPNDKQLREKRLYTFICSKDRNDVSAWVSSIKESIQGSKNRKVTVFVNPAGGNGKAVEIWKTLQRMFDVSPVQVNAIVTTHAGHAAEYVTKMDLRTCDGLVTLSGDGLLYEVLNGLLSRPDWDQARQIPLGVLPGGSGNGLAASLGVANPIIGAFNIIKGKTAPLDIWSVRQGQNRYYAFLSITWSLIADIDVESEKHRWMGGFRFTFTAVNKILSTPKPAKGKITYLPTDATTDKSFCIPRSCTICNSPQALLSHHSHSNSQSETGPTTPILSNWDSYQDKIQTLEGDFMFFSATNVRQLAHDIQAAPYAHIADGHIDLVLARKLTRPKFTKLLLDLEDGKHTQSSDTLYHKVKAFTLDPGPGSKVVMIDGERLPPDPLAVEVLPALCKIFI